MNTPLGLCRHRFGTTTCGLPLVATEFGPGHTERPRAAHYPFVPGTRGAAETDPLSAAPQAAGLKPFPAGGSSRR